MKRSTLMLALSAVLAAGSASAQNPTIEELERQLEAKEAEEAAQRRRAAQTDAERLRREQDAAAAEARLGTLLVQSDVDCRLSIDGTFKQEIGPGKIATLRLSAGDQLIECVSIQSDALRSREVRTLESGGKIVVLLSMESELRPTVAPGSQVPRPNSALQIGEEPAYQLAFEKLREGDYLEASKAFLSFIEAFPQSARAPDAMYWRGESLFVMQNYSEALTAFESVLQQHAKSSRVPDALLKLGYCYQQLGRAAEARGTLEAVIARYPGTAAAQLAESRIRTLR